MARIKGYNLSNGNVTFLKLTPFLSPSNISIWKTFRTWKQRGAFGPKVLHRARELLTREVSLEKREIPPLGAPGGKT